MRYLRTYAARPCVKCGETISSPKGPQRFCTSCKSICSVDGCTNPVRVGTICATHSSKNAKVPKMEPRGVLCALEGCEQPHKHNGLCVVHYNRFYKTGSFGEFVIAKRFPRGAPCLVDGCDKPSVGKGYCAMHYARFRINGDAGQVGLMRAEQGAGSIAEDGYRKIKTENGYEYEHRLRMAEKLGRLLRDGENVHHFDGDRLNNDPSNLELWVVQQPSGQRLADKLAAARALLTEHGLSHEVIDQSSAVLGALSFGM